MKSHGIIDKLHQLDHTFAIYLAIFAVILHHCTVVVLSSGKMASISYQLQDNV